MMDSKIPQSKTAIKAEIRKINGNIKSFGGKLKDFKYNQERHFFQRMLKAYLRGDSQFQFGLDIETKKVSWYDVILTDKSVNPKEMDKLLANGYCDPGKVFGGVKVGKSKLRADIHKRVVAARKLKEQKSIAQRLGLKK